MTEKIHPLRITLYKLATTSAHTLETDKVKTGDQWFIDRILVRNRTNDGSDVEAYINTGAYDHAVGYQRGLASNEWSTLDFDLILKEGETLKFEVSDLTASDEFDVHLTGRRVYQVD